MTLNDLILAGISALFGGGGGAALMRARGQNRTDAATALNSGQIAFNQALAQRVKDLEAADAARDAADQIRTDQYQAMAKMNAQLGASLQIKDAQLEIRDDTIAKQINMITGLNLRIDLLERENKALSERVTQLERQIEGHHAL